MSNVEIDLALVIEDAAWRDIAAANAHGDQSGIEALAEIVVREAVAGALGDGKNTVAGTHDAFELSLVLADDARLHDLNRRYRGIDAATNVLAFENTDVPPAGAPWALGDVVMAFGTMHREAAEGGMAPADHAAHLMVHGVLHLFGYDHVADVDARRMEALEVRVLAALGIADPYRRDAAEGDDGSPGPRRPTDRTGPDRGR